MKYTFTVYFIEGRDTPAVEEKEIVRLSYEVGITGLHVTQPMDVYEDNMFYEKSQMKFFEKFPRSNRYIAYAGCYDSDGILYSSEGSAAPDNVPMLKNYLPEMAAKRARVRAMILALGLKELNADIEFPDFDSDKASVEVDRLMKEKDNKLTILELHKKLGWDSKTSEIQNKKKKLLTQVGIKGSPNGMTVDQQTHYIKLLEEEFGNGES